MKKLYRPLLFLILMFTFTGCSPAIDQQQIEQTLSPDLTGTAIAARKYTEIAEATRSPATPIPTKLYPTWDRVDWTPLPSEIVANDSGKSFDFWLTSRFSVVLNKSDYPYINLELQCVPEIALGQISNTETVPPDYYVIRYEGVRLGQCVIQNGKFEVTINIIDHP